MRNDNIDPAAALLGDGLALGAFVLFLASLGLALYHVVALLRLYLDKRRLVDAVGPLAFMKGGFYSERNAYHGQRVVFYALLAAATTFII